MLIAAPRIITASDSGHGPVLAPGYVACENGIITAVGSGQPPERPDVELPDGVLLPGLIDLQVNGYYGVGFAEADADGWATVIGRLPETGTTALVPTFVTSPLGQMADSLRRAAKLVTANSGQGAGARVLGFHLEGPFISPKRRGAHNQDWIIAPDPAAAQMLLSAGSGLVKIVTIAPELDGGLAVIRQLADAGVLVSVGHSDATAAQVSMAAMSGARMVTHLFNAQRPLHHREPGVVGQALTDTRLTSSLIADLHHVAGQVAALAFTAAPGRICLVTDAAACAGMPPGRYVLGGQPIELAQGDGAPPTRADGTLAGSALRMDSAVANMVAAGIGLVDCVAAATAIPADLIGRPDLGRIAVGGTADLAWLSDDLRTRATWIGGSQVYGPGLS